MEDESSVKTRLSAAGREKISAMMKARWENPEYRAAQRERFLKRLAYQNEKNKDKLKEAMRKLNADPEFQKKRLEGMKKIKDKSREFLKNMHQNEELSKKFLAGRKKYFSDPAKNPIRLLDKWQRKEYDHLRLNKLLGRAEALRIALEAAPGLYRTVKRLFEERDKLWAEKRAKKAA